MLSPTQLPVVAKMNASFGWHSYLLSLFCTIALCYLQKTFSLAGLKYYKNWSVPCVQKLKLAFGGDSCSAVEIVMEDGAACLRLFSSFTILVQSWGTTRHTPFPPKIHFVPLLLSTTGVERTCHPRALPCQTLGRRLGEQRHSGVRLCRTEPCTPSPSPKRFMLLWKLATLWETVMKASDDTAHHNERVSHPESHRV